MTPPSDVSGTATTEQQVLQSVDAALAQLNTSVANGLPQLQAIPSPGAPKAIALLQQLQSVLTQDLTDQVHTAAAVATEMAQQTS